MKKDDIIVSVVVVSYNSSRYVLETLNSIKKQSLSKSKLELIISDDCSTDDTIYKIENWILRNKDSFSRIKLITSKENTGIPANFNRGIEEVNGEWIKIIAADDILLPNCIHDNLLFCENNTECNIVFSDLIRFNSEEKDKKELETASRILKKKEFGKKTSKEQYKELLKEYVINTPTLFFKANLVKSIKYDERYRLIDHYPLILNCLNSGEKIFYMNKATILYRVSCDSVYHKGVKGKIFNTFYRQMFAFDKDYRISNFTNVQKIAYFYDYYLKRLFDILSLNKNVFILRYLYLILSRVNIFRLLQ